MTDNQLALTMEHEPAAKSEPAVAHRFNAWEAVARRKLNAPPEWEWYRFELVGDTHDTLVTGGVPNAGAPQSRKWRGVKAQRCVVTEQEADVARADYERTTGLCHNCGGSKIELKRWSKADGFEYRECSRCRGTGQPPAASHQGAR